MRLTARTEAHASKHQPSCPTLRVTPTIWLTVTEARIAREILWKEEQPCATRRYPDPLASRTKLPRRSVPVIAETSPASTLWKGSKYMCIRYGPHIIGAVRARQIREARCAAEPRSEAREI